MAYLNMKQAADFLSCSVAHVRHLAQTKQIPAVKLNAAARNGRWLIDSELLKEHINKMSCLTKEEKIEKEI
jgi:hypothetical protein